MKKWIPLNYIILIVFGIVCLSTAGYSQQPRVDHEGHLLTMDEVDISAMVQPIPERNIFSDPNFHIWCGSVIEGKNGKYYMFYSRWPIAEGHYAWVTSSEIALAVAEKPEGPYKHLKVVMPRREVEFWDGTTTHNPAVVQHEGKYYLFYMGTTGVKEVKMPASMSDPNWWEYRNNQRIGVAIADSPEGEWTRFDKPVIDVSPDSTAFDALMMSNPAITMDDKGRAVLVYKQVAKNGTLRGGKVRFGVAFSNSLLGPYTKHDKPIFEVSKGENSWMVAEDPFIWNYKGVLYAIVTDAAGFFSNKESALVMLRSEDGINWSPTKYPKVVPLRLTFKDGRTCDDKLERPCIYFEKGVPKLLFGAHGMEKRKYSVNVAVPLKWNELSGQEIFVPRITGDWVHVYKPESDVFPGPDSKRFKTGVKYDDWQVNDHAIIKGVDDCWHTIGITHPSVAAGPGEFNPHEAEWLSFHAVSSKGTFKQNLAEHSWKDHPKILPPGERPGEIRENHAPHIILHNEAYFMIYGPSPIRYAISKDLFSWKPKGELFSQTGGARDPSIMEYNGLFYMAYCSKQSIMARVSADLLKWSEPITIFELPESETGGPESPTIHYYKGSFYLLFCRWDAKQTNRNYQDRSFVYHSDNPLNFRNRQPVAEIQGHAPELFQDEDGDWWISSAERPLRGVSIAPVKWVQLKSKE